MNSTEGSVWMRKKTHQMDQTHLFSSDTTTTIITNKKKKKKSKMRSQSRIKTKRCGLVTFEELPEYMKDNEYILDHYRANWPLKEAFFSIFRWHNETLNVWTHLIGFVLFLGLTVAQLFHVPQLTDFFNIFTRWMIIYPSVRRALKGAIHTSYSSFTVMSGGTNVSHNSKNLFLGTATKLLDLNQTTTVPPTLTEITSPELGAARWPFYVFLVGSMFCLLSSSTCHLFCCHSHDLNLFLLRIDYVGIAVMIITSFFPPISYIFQCDAHWQFIYLGGITVMGIFTIITLLSPSLSNGKYRPFRALLFVAMGLFGIVPAIHALIVNWSEPQRNVTLAYELAMALSYLIGTMFYVSRIPERWKPGWFDLAGHSHQIFHVLVVMGALAHYCAALVFLEYRDSVGCERNTS